MIAYINNHGIRFEGALLFRADHIKDPWDEILDKLKASLIQNTGHRIIFPHTMPGDAVVYHGVSNEEAAKILTAMGIEAHVV